MKSFCIALASGLFLLSVASANVVIVENGVGCADIVVGAEPTPTEKLAAEELQWHVLKISGAALNTAAEPQPGRMAIYVGRAAAAVGVKADDLELEHFRLATGPGWVAITGRDASRSEKVTDPLDIGTVQPGTLFGVYHLLDHVFGVRWLWPGEDGTFLPKRTTLTVPSLSVTSGPRLVQRNVRCLRAPWKRERMFGRADGVTLVDKSVVERQYREERLWLRRHRMGRREHFAFGHAYTHWWRKYGESHPEYFAVLPGRQQPYPRRERLKLCVSNPAVTNQIIADWVAGGAKSHLAGCPNDSRAYCTCEKCRQWDLPVETTPENVDESVLTYRYVRFWRILAEKAAAINPDAFVCGYAYSNYREPPEGVRLPPNVMLGYVGGMGEEAQEEWRKWSATGASLFFRPNWFHRGHNAFYMPLHEAGAFLKFALENNMLGTDFDSLLGHYATQGPFYYLTVRLQARPELSVEEVIGEFCAAFGPAAPEIRQYLDYWEELTVRYNDEVTKRKDDLGGGSRASLRLMPEVFGDDVLAAAGAVLASGLTKVEGADPSFAKRIRFLQEGLKHVRITRDAVRYGGDVGSVRGIRENAMKAVEAAAALRAYRKTIQDSFVDWTEYSGMKEITLGDYTGLRLAAVFAVRKPIAVLPASWYFQFDPEDVGEKEKWFRADLNPTRHKWATALVYRWWERNGVGIKWKEEHGKDYDGVGWYHTGFKPPELPAGKRVKLLFGAVDEACKVWLNGQFVGEHPFVHPDDWKVPFEFDVTDHLIPGRNKVAVRVVDNAGMGGIWKLVWLVAE